MSLCPVPASVTLAERELKTMILKELRVQKENAVRKTKIGRVVSDKMDKTVVVQVDMTRRHPIYKRTVRRSAKFLAHDERKTAQMGDLVRIVETRPLSKLKRWRVAEVVKKGERVD